MALRIGLIGGTGFYEIPDAEPIETETPFGRVELQHGTIANHQVFFVPRHGRDHTVPPHKINHRAHIDALRATRPDYIIGVNNVGALDPSLRAGSFVVGKDFVDFHRTHVTFYEDRAVHVDEREPYCPVIRRALGSGTPALPNVVFAGTDGPRFETPAEVARLRAAGAQVVGMTGVPEAVLAKERGLCFATLGYVGNDGRAAKRPVTAQAIQRRMMSDRRGVLKVLEGALRRLPSKKNCRCAEATRGADLTLGGR